MENVQEMEEVKENKKRDNAILTARNERTLAEEFLRNNAMASADQIIDYVQEKMLETTESGNYRYIAGERKPVSRDTLALHLTGKIMLTENGKGEHAIIGPDLLPPTPEKIQRAKKVLSGSTEQLDRIEAKLDQLLALVTVNVD